MEENHLFPTAVVGSFPRPRWLLEAIDRHEKGEISHETLAQVYDDAVELTIKEQELAGVDVISDGEQRRFSFLAYVAEKLPSFKLTSVEHYLNSEAKKWVQSMKLPTTVIKNPFIVGRITLEKKMAIDEFEFAKRFTKKMIKAPLIGPYTLLINSWNKKLCGDVYPSPEDAAKDICSLIREEISALSKAGASVVQLDEPGIGNFVDYRYTRFLLALNEWKIDDLRSLHTLSADLVNSCVDGISGIKTSVHICRGNWPAEEKYLSYGGYDKMLPEILDMKVDQLVLEMATTRAGSFEVFNQYSFDHEIGLGVIDVKSPRVESREEIVRRAEAALKIIDPGKLWLNPDCGFASGRPWPVVDRQTSFRKLNMLSLAAEDLRRKYA